MLNLHKSKFACFIIIICLVQIGLPKSAKATHTEYIAQDSTAQINVNPKGNFIYDGWYTGAFLPGDDWFALHWAAQDATAKTYMDIAIYDWNQYDISQGIVWHDWQYQSAWPNTSANLQVFHGGCDGLPGAGSCFAPIQMSVMTSQNASVWYRAKLYFDTALPPGKTPGPNYYRTMIMHEVGHACGLDERYNHSTGACGSETTIMDAWKYTGNMREHCDPITTLAAIDKSRITTYYKSNSYNMYLAARDSNNNNVINTISKDLLWGEIGMYVDYYKIISSTNHEYKGRDTIFTNVGVHQTVHDRNITTSRDVVTAWGAGTYKVCVRGWFGTNLSGIDVVGPRVCVIGV